MKVMQRILTLVLFIIFYFSFGISNVNSQSVFDKIESFLVSRNFQLSYGVQSAWYKESTIHFIQERYNRDLLIHDVRAVDKIDFNSLSNAQLTVSQFKVNIEFDLSERYSFFIFTSHIGYHADVQRNYYKIGLWDNERVSNSDNLSEHFEDLEHSNGINPLNIGIRRRISLLNKKTSKHQLEFGISSNVGIIYTATQAKIKNPDNEIEVYNLGNKLAGYNYGIESDLRLYIKGRWMVGLNFNYFHMRVRKAKLENNAHVSHNIIGSNFGINIGFRI